MPLPPGLLINPATGVISGRPEQSGTYSVTIKASNIVDEDTKTYSVTITDDRIPRITTPRVLPTGRVWESYSVTLEASGEAPILWSVREGTSLPIGLTLSSEGVISGVPAENETFHVDIAASNDYGSDTETFTISIRENLRPHIMTESIPAGIVGFPYTARIEWAGYLPITVGALSAPPEGLTAVEHDTYLSITGTPTHTVFTQLYPVILSNIYGSDQKTFNFVITDSIPIIGTPPEGGVGVSYDYTFTTNAGTAPFTWAFTPLILSTSGLSFDTSTGRLYGRPTASGSWIATVSVTDAAGASGSKRVYLVIIAG